MASVLITGMTSPQCSSRYIERSASFAAAMARSLRSAGVRVEISEPSLAMTRQELDQYSAILVGVSPLLSLSANHCYGALSVISSVRDGGKLRLFVDAPEPGRIRSGLRAVTKDPSSLTKAFYAGRKEYRAVSSSKKLRASVYDAVEFLNNSWANVPTLYPALPFSDDSVVKSALFGETQGALCGINLDAAYLQPSVMSARKHYVRSWVVDNDKTRWFKGLQHVIRMPYAQMKKHKGETDVDVLERISAAHGALIGPSDDGIVWWSHRYVQALNAGTPIVTEWRLASTLGQSWSHIAASVEEMTQIDLFETALQQKADYISSIQDRDESTETLMKEIGIK